MAEPLILKFTMTLDDLLRSRRAILRHTDIGRESRKAERSMILIALVSLVVGLAMLAVRSGGEFAAIQMFFGIGLTVVGVLLLAFPVLARYQTTKNFAAHPQKDEEQIWQIYPDRILGTTDEETPWSIVVRVVGTRDGFLLCCREKPFIWLPLRAFVNKKDVEEFSRIVQGQVKQYESKI